VYLVKREAQIPGTEIRTICHSQGCSKSPFSKAAATEGPKAYPLGYVEGLSDAGELFQHPLFHGRQRSQNVIPAIDVNHFSGNSTS